MKSLKLVLDALDYASSIFVAAAEVIAGFDRGCEVENETDYCGCRGNDIHDGQQDIVEYKRLSKRGRMRCARL